MPYTLQGKSGTVRFHNNGTVTEESKKFSGKVTSYPVEQGYKISDHFERDPATQSIKGILVGGGSAVATLESMFMKGDILVYTGSFRMTSIVLTSLDFSTNSSNKNGFSFTANFQRLEVASAQYVPVGEQPLMSDQDKGKSTAASSGGKAAQDGLQTTTSEAISSSAYANYVDTFNNKPAPGAGPSSRSTPTYTGF